MRMQRRRFLTLPLSAALSAAPAEFSFRNIRGEKESLSRYRGKAVAIYFFNPG